MLPLWATDQLHFDAVIGMSLYVGACLINTTWSFVLARRLSSARMAVYSHTAVLGTCLKRQKL